MGKIFVITKDYCDYEGLGELSRQEIKAAATLEDAKTIAKQMWKEDIRMYHSHGMNPIIIKIEKMMWKIPQFVMARFK